MEYRYIGKSGLRVTPICMGTMTFGSWSDKKESFKILDTAFDRGINFFDTAELYPFLLKRVMLELRKKLSVNGLLQNLVKALYLRAKSQVLQMVGLYPLFAMATQQSIVFTFKKRLKEV